jgi:hypothetical protein
MSDQDIVVGVVEYEFYESRLGVAVLQRSFQWANPNEPDSTGEANGVVFAFEISNTGTVAAELNDVLVGLYLDADLLASAGWFDDVVGYDGDTGILYMFDSGTSCSTGVIPCPPGYIGVAVLSDATEGGPAMTVSPATATCQTYDTGSPCPPWPHMITSYDLMSSGINMLLLNGDPIPLSDYRMMIVAPPFSLAAHETKTVSFAIALGAGFEALAANMGALASVYEPSRVDVEAPTTDSKGEFILEPTYPNPTGGATTLSFVIPERGEILLTILNMLGQNVRTITNGVLESGRHEIPFDGTGLASGTYVVKLQTPRGVMSRPMVVVR